ncbi:ZIP family metal transporter, partial [Candidatus Woesearchaeota archaeon]|nr:ZIP family metal transporter [Candidatus Woesearchaeota archaeon]
IGALGSRPFISRLSPQILGTLLSISAGALIYIGATHLLPKVEKENEKYSILALIAGIIVAIVIILSGA